MNKIPRFMSEYAGSQRKYFQHNELIQKEYKDFAIQSIDRVLEMYKRGLITVNEGMEMLLHPLKGICEEE